MNSHAAGDSSSSSSTASLVTASTATSKEKEPFRVRAELYAPTRLAPEVFAVFRLRALVVDVVAHESLLLVLLAARSVLAANAIRTGAAATSAALHSPPTTPQLPRVGILGGGHVGSAVALALLQHNYPRDRLAISTRQPERVPKCDALQSSQAQALYHSVLKYYDNARLGRESDVLVLCMPPSQLKSVAIQLKHALSVSDAPTLVVSALCGVSRELLQKSCGSKLVARVKASVAELGDGGAPSSSVVVGEDATVSGVGVGNGSSVVEIAARELGTALMLMHEERSAREGSVGQDRRRDSPESLTLHADVFALAVCLPVAQDDEQLAEVLADFGLRFCLAADPAPPAAGGQDDSSLEDAVRHQMRVTLGSRLVDREEEDEAVPQQLMLALASAWISDWDAVVAVIREQQQQLRRRRRSQSRKTSRVGA